MKNIEIEKDRIMTKLLCTKNYKPCDSLELWINKGDIVEHVGEAYLIYEVKDGKEKGLRFKANLEDTITHFVMFTK